MRQCSPMLPGSLAIVGSRMLFTHALAHVSTVMVIVTAVCGATAPPLRCMTHVVMMRVRCTIVRLLSLRRASLISVICFRAQVQVVI